MKYLNLHYFLFTIAVWLITNNGIVDAKLTITAPDNTTATYPTLDYFYHRQSYYHYSGISVFWPWKANTTSCTMEDGGWIESHSNETDMLRSYDNLTITTTTSAATSSGCVTIAQIGLELERLSKQLTIRGMPPIKQFIFLGDFDLLNNNSSTPLWGYGNLWYITRDPSRIPDGPPSMNVALVDKPDALSILFSLHGTLFFHFDIEQEPGMWNELYLSAGYVAYKWIYFILVVASLIYAYTRVFMLIRMGVQLKGLRLVSFVLASISSILYLIENRISQTSYLGIMLTLNFTLLYTAAVDVILWYWSSYGTTTFSKVSLICFRLTIVLSFLLNAIMYIIYTILANIKIDTDKISTLWVVAIAVGFPVPIINSIIFGGFILWFGYCMYQVRQHPKARKRFTQLIVFSTVAWISYGTMTIENIITNNEQVHGVQPHYKEAFIFHIIADIRYISNSIVCLMVFGVYWPRQTDQDDKKPSAPLGGMTTIGYDAHAQEMNASTRPDDNSARPAHPVNSPKSVIQAENVTVEVV